MTGRTPQRPPDLPGFRAIELLGSGGFSDVFRYEQLGLGRQVAVKVLLADLGPAAQQQFRTEANLMAKLSSHPSIVSVFSSGMARDGRAYLVLELCPAPPLAARIARRPYAVPKALDIAIQIAGAVETAHRLGILHRDIKPANILFTEYGRPALTDFGIAGNTTGAGIDAFSVVWAPPEQIAGNPTGPSADVYSLAATTFAMLTGHSPAEPPGAPNDTWAITQRVRSAPPPPTGRPDVPESLERILATALAKAPEARYRSALEYARALQEVQTELRAPVTPIDVLADDKDDWAADVAGGGTRVTGFAAFDQDGDAPGGPPGGAFGRGVPHTVESGWPAEPPGASGSVPPSPGWMHEGYDPSPVIQHLGNRPAAPPRQWTQGAMADAQGSGETSAEPVEALRQAQGTRGRRGLKVLLIAAALILVLGITAIAGRTLTETVRSTSEDDRATPSARPVDPVGTIVPPPTEVTLVRDADRITVTWTNPDPRDGDSYLYRVPVPGREEPFRTTTDTTATVTAPPGRTCVEVLLRRGTGRSSEPAVGCLED